MLEEPLSESFKAWQFWPKVLTVSFRLTNILLGQNAEKEPIFK